MDLGLSDRVYIVAGGVDGLGLATAERLVAEGARVVLSDRRELPLQEAATELGSRSVVSVVPDGVEGGPAERLVSAALDTWGRVDGALVCVDSSPKGHVSDVTDDEWTAAFESVFLGTVRLCRHIAHTLPRGGSLALVLSPSVYEPVAERAIANGLQRGLASIALELAEELGPSGVRVNGPLPDHVAAPHMAESATDETDPDRSADNAAVPMGRRGAPDEFARVAAFLLSPAASYISGSMIPIDGGMLRSI